MTATCEKCGQVHERCAGHSKQNEGRPCHRYPIPGGTVCVSHGGGAGQVRAAANRRLRTEAIEADITAELAHEGIDAIEDPLDELSKLAAAATAMMEALGARVNALRDVSTMDGNGKESIRAEVILYERAMDRAGKFLQMLVAAGFMERQVKIQEGTADAVVNVLQRIFTRLELSPQQQALIGTVVPEELRALEM